MSAAVDILTGSLLSVSLQVSILIGIIWFISLFAKRASAEFRYLLWCIVLVRLCIPVGFNLPFLPSFQTGEISTEQYQTNSEPIDKQPSVTKKTIDPSIAAAAVVIAAAIAANQADKQQINYSLIMILLWISGIASITIITLRRNIILHRKLKKCPQIERNDLNNLLSNLCRQMNLRQVVSLRYMDPAVYSGPVASGLFRYKIFLPPDIADSWPVNEIEPILLHELSHIKRHDSIVNFIQTVVQTIYFFHPLVWLVNSRINSIREEACDDMAIGYLEGETDRYSTSILNVIGFMKNEKSYGLAGFGFAEMKNSLGKRIKRILNENYKLNRKMSVLSFIGLVLIGFVGIAIAGASAKSSESLANITENDRKINDSENDKNIIFNESLIDSNKVNINEDIIKVAEKGDNLIKTGKVKFIEIRKIVRTYSQTSEDFKKEGTGIKSGRKLKTFIPEKSETTIIFSKDKIRKEEKYIGRVYPNRAMATDTLIDIYFDKDLFSKEYSSFGIETKFDKSANYKKINALDFVPGYYIQNTPVAVFLKGNIIVNSQKFPLRNLKYVKDEKINNILCSIFSAEYSSPYTMDTSIMVWLGKNIMFRPIKIQSVQKNEVTEEKRIQKIIYKKYKSIWFPDIIENKSFSFDKNSKQTKETYDSETRIEEFEFNTDIPDSFFNVPADSVNIINSPIPFR